MRKYIIGSLAAIATVGLLAVYTLPLPHWAISSNNTGILKILYQIGGKSYLDKYYQPNKMEKMRPIEFACRSGQKDAFQYLIDIGISPDPQNNDDFGCIGISLLYGQDEMVELALKNGANPNIIFNKQESPVNKLLWPLQLGTCDTPTQSLVRLLDIFTKYGADFDKKYATRTQHGQQWLSAKDIIRQSNCTQIKQKYLP